VEARAEMLKVLDRDELIAIGEEREGPCVSIFLPLAGAGRETRADRVRLGHLGKQAIQGLAAGGVREESARRLVQPVVDAVRASREWERPGSALAIFIAPGEAVELHAPVTVSERVLIGPRFITRPLLPLTGAGSHVTVLALAAGYARLLQIGLARAAPVETPGMPASEADITQLDVSVERWHFNAPGPYAAGGAHGGLKDTSIEVDAEYVRDVEAAVRAHATRDSGAIVLMGDHRLLSAFRREARGMKIAAEEIDANPERITQKELVTRAWEIAGEMSERAAEEALGRLFSALGSDRVVTHPGASLRAAFRGQVRDLFIGETAEALGQADGKGKIVEEASHMGEHEDDLLDLAAHLTLKNGGAVRIVPDYRLPDDGDCKAAALLR
jgi:hypothetical protein